MIKGKVRKQHTTCVSEMRSRQKSKCVEYSRTTKTNHPTTTSLSQPLAQPVRPLRFQLCCFFTLPYICCVVPYFTFYSPCAL